MFTSPYDEKTVLGFKFVCGQINNICRLCLSPTENDKIKLDNTVDLEKEYCNYTISYQTMLTNLNVQNECKLPEMICENCAETTLKCYLFHKLVQFSSQKWSQVMHLLKNSLSKLDIISETKSAYIILNSSENLIFKSSTSYDIESENTNVVMDFQKRCQNYIQRHKKYICKKCYEQFDSQNFLNKHMKIQHQKTMFCWICSKKFKSINIYHNHIRIYHQKDIQHKYICDHCNKCYKKKDGLRSHIKIQHGFGDVLVCNWCFKRFDAVSRLRSHILKHTKEKNFDCNVCNRQFVSNTALMYHKRLHSGERPYPCDMCDKSFLSSSRQLEHKKRKHIGPQKECTLCDMKFVTTYQLRRHFNRHFNPASKLFLTKDCFEELKRRGKVK